IDRRADEPLFARRSFRNAEHGFRYARCGDCRPLGELFLARHAQRQNADGERGPPLPRNQTGARLHRPHAGRGSERRHPAGRDPPGQHATDLKFGSQYGAKGAPTGPVPIPKEEYPTLQGGAFVNTAATIVVVLPILWLALRSWRIILAVFVILIGGLSITA